jgi:hypothetical protein
MGSSDGESRYVYGVVRADGPRPRDTGINGKPVRVVALEGIGALTSSVPDRELEAGRDELMAHSQVLERALERGVVLPMQFGMVMPDDEAVRELLLAAHRKELEAQLREMANKVEVNIKGIYEEGAVLREVLAESDEMAQLREAIRDKPEDATYFERIRLGELVAEALEAKQSVDERSLIDRLVPHAIAVELGQTVHERMALNASFLVDRGAIEDFDRAVDKLGKEQAERIRFKYTGPLPPHSFVELSMEAV